MTRESLITEIQSGFVPHWTFFWGHQAAVGGSITKSCLSQWWEGHPFEVEGVLYPTAEHFMMAGKARLFDDTETLEEILAAKGPAEAKKLGRNIRPFDEGIWLKQRGDIVVQGNLAKFGQHEPLRTFLLDTSGSILVEASPYDNVWGIGLDAADPDAPRPENWKGLNLLGFALMQVRQRLRQNASSPPKNDPEIEPPPSNADR
jgi:ribA/ribD-fused uncharacterized protein